MKIETIDELKEQYGYVFCEDQTITVRGGTNGPKNFEFLNTAASVLDSLYVRIAIMNRLRNSPPQTDN